MVRNSNPEVRTARLADASIPWVAGNHLQREPGVAYLGVRVAYHAEGDSIKRKRGSPDPGATLGATCKTTPFWVLVGIQEGNAVLKNLGLYNWLYLSLRQGIRYPVDDAVAAAMEMRRLVLAPSNNAPEVLAPVFLLIFIAIHYVIPQSPPVPSHSDALLSMFVALTIRVVFALLGYAVERRWATPTPLYAMCLQSPDQRVFVAGPCSRFPCSDIRHPAMPHCCFLRDLCVGSPVGRHRRRHRRRCRTGQGRSQGLGQGLGQDRTRGGE